MNHDFCDQWYMHIYSKWKQHCVEIFEDDASGEPKLIQEGPSTARIDVSTAMARRQTAVFRCVQIESVEHDKRNKITYKVNVKIIRDVTSGDANLAIHAMLVT